MNIVVLQGNVAQDPIVRDVKTGDRSTKVANFSLAVNRYFKKKDGQNGSEVTFIDCEAWDTGAETMSNKVTKGTGLIIEGTLKKDTWETDDGQKRSRVKVRVSKFNILPRAPKSEDADTTEAEAKETVAAAADSDGPGEDIPF